MRIKYSSNNSGGSWWLTDKDWYALEKAGWEIQWYKDEKDILFRSDDGRFLGALASEASKDFENPGDAMREFEKITGQDVSNEGCNCCGSPHGFSWEGKKPGYASGAGCLSYLFPKKKTNLTKRQLLESA